MVFHRQAAGTAAGGPALPSGFADEHGEAADLLPQGRAVMKLLGSDLGSWWLGCWFEDV